jgi:DNA-binding transcriptional ArsR family regulator
VFYYTKAINFTKKLSVMSDSHNHHDLDKIFEALGNEHRREIVYVLGLQPCSISQLASMRGLSLPAIHKHIKLLEDANLIIRKKIGRTNVLTLNRSSLRVLQDWVTQYHTYWGSDKETLENYARYFDTDNTN